MKFLACEDVELQPYNIKHEKIRSSPELEPRLRRSSLYCQYWSFLDHLGFQKRTGFLFPECVARFLFHSGGLGAEGAFARRCVYVRNRSQPRATVRNRAQPSATVRAIAIWPYGKFSRRGHFWRFQTSRCFVSRGRRGTSWNSDVLFCNVLAVSCPYSRAEHIPCQSSWEISGNCEDPFQVKFVFHTVCQVLLFFWHVRCRLHMFFRKGDPYFQQFLEMSLSIMLSFPKMD